MARSAKFYMRKGKGVMRKSLKSGLALCLAVAVLLSATGMAFGGAAEIPQTVIEDLNPEAGREIGLKPVEPPVKPIDGIGDVKEPEEDPAVLPGDAAEDTAADPDTTVAAKAIYILPGYLGSRLFHGETGEEIWVGGGLLEDIARSNAGLPTQLQNNADGTGLGAVIDAERDTCGTLDNYKVLMESLREGLAARGAQDEYDVVFFPYNWLGDLNDSSKALERHIAERGYQSVVLLTHSTGGLLASTFVAAGEANRALVEKAIVVAAPLYGTYAALQPIETGTTTLYDGTSISSLLMQLGYCAVVKPLTRDWVQGWAKNSPTTYQLLPSGEYLAQIPAVYRTGLFKAEQVADAEAFYGLLNRSPRINPNLTDGNEHSHAYHRTQTLHNDIIAQLEQVDTVLIGCESGFLTPMNAVYRKSLFGDRAILDDIVFSRGGDGTVAAISANGNGRLAYLNFPGVSHGALVKDEIVLACINGLIEGGYVYSEPEALKGAEAGMDDLLKLQVKGDADVGVIVYDAAGEVVALADAQKQYGFDHPDFLCLSLADEEYGSNMILYLPKDGYRVEFATASQTAEVDFTVSVARLYDDGTRRSEATYRIDRADGGTLFTLDRTDAES